MKKIFLTCVLMAFFPSIAFASKMNLTPYFGLGVDGLQAELAGNKARSPGLTFIAGTSLDWISSHVATEFRFGFGGQFTTFNGSVNNYTSYLIKPSFGLSEQFDIYGLLGVTSMSVTIAGNDSSDAGLSYGAGFRYHIPNESLSIDGEWMMYHKDTDTSTSNISGMKVTGLSLNVTFEYY
jgi:hypothetical protein